MSEKCKNLILKNKYNVQTYKYVIVINYLKNETS